MTFYVLLISNGLAAAYAPIQDCDETFNYWDPTHYLQHGYGRQTWEYSPEYGIRSWLYILLHAAVGKVSSIWATRKITQFYAIRFVLGFVCAACETRLYSAISRSLNPRIGVLFLLIVASSPGFFHASAAYLPSSFTMYTSMLGLAAFLNKGGNRRVADGIVWFGFGAIVGWPFAGALLLPMLLEEVVTGALSGRFSSTLWVVARGAYDCLLILVGTVVPLERELANSIRSSKCWWTRSSLARQSSCRGISLRIMSLEVRAEVQMLSALSHGLFTCGICSSTSMSGLFWQY